MEACYFLMREIIKKYFFNIFSFMLEDIYFYPGLLQDIMFVHRVSRHLFLKLVELNHV